MSSTTCTRCDIEKAPTEFVRSSTRVYRWCRSCWNAYYREYRHKRSASKQLVGQIQHVPDPPRSRTSSSRDATITPSEVDLYWIAGFLTGTGSITNNCWSRTIIRIDIPDQETAEWIHQRFGGTYGKRPHRSSPCTWEVSGARAVGILLTLFSFLGSSRKTTIIRLLDKKSTRGLQ